MSATCCFETITARGCVSVQRCIECGNIVLNVSCVSLRLDIASFDTMVDVLLDARAEMARRSSRYAMTPGARGLA